MSTNASTHAEVKRVSSLVRAILAHQKAEDEGLFEILSPEIGEDYYPDRFPFIPCRWVYACGCVYVPTEDQRNFVHGGDGHGKLLKACLGQRLLYPNTYNN